MAVQCVRSMTIAEYLMESREVTTNYTIGVLDELDKDLNEIY